MVTIRNVKTLAGTVEDHTIEGPDTQMIDCEGKLTLLPALIDLNTHFGPLTTWAASAKRALAGGITTLFESSKEVVTVEKLRKRQAAADKELVSKQIPLRTHFYIEAHPDHATTLGRAKQDARAISLRIQPETKDHFIRSVFQIAAQENMMIAVSIDTPSNSSERAVHKILEIANDWNNALFFLNISKQKELDLIRRGKEMGMLLFAATTPLHLFSGKKEADALFQGIHEETIDVICSDHPIDSPSAQLTLPPLLHAVHEKKLSLGQVIKLTRVLPEQMFNLPRNQDRVLVDLNDTREAMHSLSPTKKLTGWPVWTIVKGILLKTSELT